MSNSDGLVARSTTTSSNHFVRPKPNRDRRGPQPFSAETEVSGAIALVLIEKAVKKNFSCIGQRFIDRGASTQGLTPILEEVVCTHPIERFSPGVRFQSFARYYGQTE